MRSYIPWFLIELGTVILWLRYGLARTAAGTTAAGD